MEQESFIDTYTNQNIEFIVKHKYLTVFLKIQSKKYYCNSEMVRWKNLPQIDGMSETYFHLITVTAKEMSTYCCPNRIIQCDRTFSYNPMMGPNYSDNEKRSICGHRIQCLPLFIKTMKKSDNLIWEEKRSTRYGKKCRIHILNQSDKYLIVIEHRNNGTMLFWTAYPVNRERVSDLKRRYKKHPPINNYKIIVI